MMVKCICVNDANRPKEIPANKWLKAGDPYTIIYTVKVLPQKRVGVLLAEIELTENEKPYEYFLLERFGFTSLDDVLKLNQLIKDCTDMDFSVEELIEQTELITAE